RKPRDRRERRSYIGALGIVDVANTRDVRDPLRAMRKTRKLAQLLDAGGALQRKRIRERERREGVSGVVQPGELELREWTYALTVGGQPNIIAATDQTVVGGLIAQREAHAALPGAHHGRDRRIV